MDILFDKDYLKDYMSQEKQVTRSIDINHR